MKKALLIAVFASLIIAGCTDKPLNDSGVRISASTGELRLPVVSMASQKFATIVRQQYDFSCGSAALATLLTYQYGERHSEQDVFVGMWNDGDRAQIRKLGFSLLDMKRYLKGAGLESDGYRVSLEQIQKAGIPGIALITVKGYRHFVVVKGVTAQKVLMGDPAQGLRTLGIEEFKAAWNGIYFVVAEPGEKKRFNSDQDWQLLPRARYMQALEPLSLQALSIMAPTYGQF